MRTKIMPKFNVGITVATPGALEALERDSSDTSELFHRHASGDWGDISEEDKSSNEAAIENGSNIMSEYVLTDGTRIWVISDPPITSGVRTTTILLPEEY